MKYRIVNKISNVLRMQISNVPWKLLGFFFSVLNRSFIARRKFKKQNVGHRSYIDPSVQILGWKNVRVGMESVISEGTWLNINYHNQPDWLISIGNNCHLGKRNFISCGPGVEIKDYCMTSVDCHILGCGHNIDTPMIPYNASGPSLGKKISVGVNCWLGASVTILEGVEIGCGSIIGAGSVVTKSVPPFSIAVGNPCVVIKRYDFLSKKWLLTCEWNSDLERYMPTESQYLLSLKESNPRIGRCLITSGNRFGWI